MTNRIDSLIQYNSFEALGREDPSDTLKIAHREDTRDRQWEKNVPTNPWYIVLWYKTTGENCGHFVCKHREYLAEMVEFSSTTTIIGYVDMVSLNVGRQNCHMEKELIDKFSWHDNIFWWVSTIIFLILILLPYRL